MDKPTKPVPCFLRETNVIGAPAWSQELPSAQQTLVHQVRLPILLHYDSNFRGVVFVVAFLEIVFLVRFSLDDFLWLVKYTFDFYCRMLLQRQAN